MSNFGEWEKWISNILGKLGLQKMQMESAGSTEETKVKELDGTVLEWLELQRIQKWLEMKWMVVATSSMTKWQSEIYELIWNQVEGCFGRWTLELLDLVFEYKFSVGKE